MTIVYEHIETSLRHFQGISLEEKECQEHLKNKVKDNLLDCNQREDMLDELAALKADTGFEGKERLLADIQALENDEVNVQNFRIGEAYAEIILEERFECRFHWNELRDARNPKGNKTGADLVGFIEVEGDVLFLFGEVKTSSENTQPPQVMTCEKGMENQLCDLYRIPEKRRILISYLQSKANLFDNDHQFKKDFNASLRTYYQSDNYQLTGVLIRDTEPEEKDISKSYHKLKEEILEPKGLHLLALYLPIKQAEWLQIINETKE